MTEATLMQIVKPLKTIGLFAWPLVFCLPHLVFSKVSERIEPTLLAQGHPSLWWTIVLLYWLIDAATVIGLVSLYRWPIFPRRVDRVSILVLTSEISVIVLFFHLALLARDHILRASLESIGLGGLPQFFLIIMSVLMLFVFLKYEKQNHADVGTSEKDFRGKRPGRRTSILRNPSWSRYRNRKG
jgi:hypothetical protein